MDSEIVVAIQIIRQEPDAALHRHGLSSHWQQLQLLCRQAGAGADIAARKDAEAVETHLHFGNVFFILCGSCRAKANGIAEVIKTRSRHDRVEIDDAQRFARFCVQQDVIELRVIVCHAQRQFAGSQRILNSCHLCLPGQRKFNFRLNLRCPVHGVALQCLQKRAVTVRCIVEIRDGLVQLRRREIRQELLEGAEAHGALIKVLVRLGKLEANRIFHKVIRAPIGILRMQIACAVMRFYKRQDAARVVCFCPQELRDGSDIFHQPRHVAERVAVDFLQDIAPAAFRHGKIGHIDVPTAIRLTGNRLRVQPEGAQYFKQVFVHFQSSSV